MPSIHHKHPAPRQMVTVGRIQLIEERLHFVMGSARPVALKLASRPLSTFPVKLSPQPRPVPAYPDAEVEALSKRAEDLRARRDKLRAAGAGKAADDLDREYREVRGQLREGGQLRAGDSLGGGRYLLLREIGRGGFAVVWEAYDDTEEQRVAVKVLHANLAGDRQRRERLFRGALAMATLEHPAVVRVLEPEGEDGCFYYFVMEFVPAGDLRQAVLAQRVKRDEVFPLVLQVGDALASAHARGMIHRDVKPANILLDDQGNAKLTDFDLVAAHDTTGGTRTGAFGTVVYAAPECLEKAQEATARADVYGLGMTVIFGLLGRELSLSTFRNSEPTIAGLDCSAEVKDVLRRAVAWEPEQRFADAGGMVAALKKAQVEPSQERTELEERPAWAVVSGRDRYGLWAAFEVAGVRQRMRWIPPGTFLMGSRETELGRGSKEGPQHEVTLTRGYWLGDTPVTQALWVAVMGKNPSHFRGGPWKDLQRPVESISWDDCQVFLDQLNAQVASLAARLPTEAEWERACRAGTMTATWVGDLSGDVEASELHAIAWYYGNSHDMTHPVGRKAPNSYGLHDMLGNVWERCADEMRSYRAETVTDPRGAGGDSDRVIRGGSWGFGARFLRAAHRQREISFRDGHTGFRLAGGQESVPSKPSTPEGEPRSGDQERGAGHGPSRASERDTRTLASALEGTPGVPPPDTASRPQVAAVPMQGEQISSPPEQRPTNDDEVVLDVQERPAAANEHEQSPVVPPPRETVSHAPVVTSPVQSEWIESDEDLAAAKAIAGALFAERNQGRRVAPTAIRRHGRAYYSRVLAVVASLTIVAVVAAMAIFGGMPLWPDARYPAAVDKVLAPLEAGIAAMDATAAPGAPDAALGASAAAPGTGCPADMVAIPPGTFQMGSPAGEGDSDEHPAHEVTLSAYCIDRTEVTVKAYMACVRSKACTPADEREETGPRNGCNGTRPDRQDHPINCVTWDQASAYCAWAGRRLPTEAEWEYAARGSDGRRYPWGNDTPTAQMLNACGRECVQWSKRELKKDWRAMYDASDGWETTAPVGSFPNGASPFGAQDMAGNVREWTADGYDKYDGGAATNPAGPRSGTQRVIRGGGWHTNDSARVRAAYRSRNAPSLRSYGVGFRCPRRD